MRIQDLTGYKNDLLTWDRPVVKGDPEFKKGRLLWYVDCECGGRTVVDSKHHRRNISCGCMQGKPSGFPRTVLRGYYSWQGAKQRCQDPGCVGYERYGAIGITMCQGWQSNVNFVADMGERPLDKDSLDRLDNEGGYWCGHCDDCVSKGQPMNCRWATTKEQAENKRPRKKKLKDDNDLAEAA